MLALRYVEIRWDYLTHLHDQVTASLEAEGVTREIAQDRPDQVIEAVLVRMADDRADLPSKIELMQQEHATRSPSTSRRIAAAAAMLRRLPHSQ